VGQIPEAEEMQRELDAILSNTSVQEGEEAKACKRGLGLPQSVALAEREARPPRESTEVEIAGMPEHLPSGIDPSAEAGKLLQEGRIQDALDYLRPLVFPHGDPVNMSHDTPLSARITFIHGLWRSSTYEGVRRFLADLPEQDDPRVLVLQRSLRDWKGSLTWAQKMGLRKKPDLPEPPEPPLIETEGPDVKDGPPKPKLLSYRKRNVATGPAPFGRQSSSKAHGSDAKQPAETDGASAPASPVGGTHVPESPAKPVPPASRSVAAPSGDSADPLARREIRVFISSTFRDMMRERDLLVKRVFPALRRICAKRFVTFTEVDLRWGITEEQAAEGRCCRSAWRRSSAAGPTSSGCWANATAGSPTSFRAEVIEREPWLKEHVEDRKSVTELEILHGVLNNPEMAGHAFFYFRDPAYVERTELPEEERLELVERDVAGDIEGHGAEDATRRTKERKDKLAALKQRIRVSGLPVVDPYADPEDLAERIEEQFTRLIDELYPEDETPDPLVQERMAHEAHARNKLFACIDRPEHLAVLNGFASEGEHDGKGLVVTGESGGGKTSLLAAWARDWAANHPEDFLFQHYFGATPDSASPEGFLRRLMGELRQRFEINEDIPSEPEKLRETLPLWLAQTVSKGPVVLVLDGLNQVRGSEPDQRLLFLPRHLPRHVVAIASALAGPALDALRERGWTEHELPLATEAEIDAMVAKYLGHHSRALEPALQQAVVTAPGPKNPLFLRTVLEELRQFGSFERLPERVAHYLEVSDPKELFQRVIARWQEDFDGNDSEGASSDLVRRALTHLWAAREGLSEPEWLDLLGDGERRLPRALWTPLFFALEPHLSQREGLFAYGHDFLRQAVEETAMPTEEQRRVCHLRIADYFELHPQQRAMSSRKAAEWPYQLRAANAWDRLKAGLRDISLFLALCNDETQWEMTRYWLSFPHRMNIDMGSELARAVDDWQKAPAHTDDIDVSAEVGLFLQQNGYYEDSDRLLRSALGRCESRFGRGHPTTLLLVGNLGATLESKGDYTAAQPLLERALQVSSEVLGVDHPRTLARLSNLAYLLESKGDYAAAQRFFERALDASRRVLGPEHPNTLVVMNNLAHLMQGRGDFSGARAMFERTLRARERVLGAEHPATLVSMNNLGCLLQEVGDGVSARSLHERALEIRRRVLGVDHPHTLASMNNLALVLSRLG
jgi:nephrocystin-3